MRLRPGDLAASPAEGARRVALALLDEAGAAAERLERGADGEALHDFRVGVRRLRSTLKAYRPWLGGPAMREAERRLRKLARRTNPARDAEVQLEWLAGQRDVLSGPRPRRGLEWLVARIEAGRAAPGAAAAVARFRHAAGELRRDLEQPTGGARRPRTAHASAPPPGSFGAAAAVTAGGLLEDLGRRLARVRGSEDVEAVHRSRIVAKRLRYVIEPLRGRTRGATQVVHRLKGLQDALGELHDAHVLGAEVREALADAAPARARRLFEAVSASGPRRAAAREALRGDPVPGLLALARLVRDRREALFAGLERALREGAFEALAASLRAVAGRLVAPAPRRTATRAEVAPPDRPARRRGSAAQRETARRAAIAPRSRRRSTA